MKAIYTATTRDGVVSYHEDLESAKRVPTAATIVCDDGARWNRMDGSAYHMWYRENDNGPRYDGEAMKMSDVTGRFLKRANRVAGRRR